MTGRLEDLAGRAVFICDAEGPRLVDEGSAVDLVGAVYGSAARIVVIPVSRLGEMFLQLRSGLAGAVIQKFVNYGLHPVFVGDVSAAVAASAALRDYVREANRGRHVWFVADLAELEARLTASSPPC